MRDLATSQAAADSNPFASIDEEAILRVDPSRFRFDIERAFDSSDSATRAYQVPEELLNLARGERARGPVARRTRFRALWVLCALAFSIVAFGIYV